MMEGANAINCVCSFFFTIGRKIFLKSWAKKVKSIISIFTYSMRVKGLRDRHPPPPLILLRTVNTMYNDFYLDLEDGKRGERLVAAALTARGHKVTDLSDDREARFNDIDLLLDNGKQTTTLEVKNDLRSETTGNVFIETYNIKNISHSFEGWFFYCRACYVCFIQENNRLAHIVALNDIKEIIEKNKYRIANSSNAKGYLVPIDDIKALTSYYCLTL